jgi:hypothetical protein
VRAALNAAVRLTSWIIGYRIFRVPIDDEKVHGQCEQE